MGMAPNSYGKDLDMKLDMAPDWMSILLGEFDKKYMSKLYEFLDREYKKGTKTLPDYSVVFKALKLTDYPDVKVVILGQEPSAVEGQATGLAFAVGNGVASPALKTISKELSIEFEKPLTDLTLESWAKQGVLLLNTTLTVQESILGSHVGRGWEKFTDKVITSLDASESPIVFLLWGEDAKKKASLITNPRHLILEAANSTSSEFLGNGHFKKVNTFLEQKKLTPIEWV